MDCKNTVFKPWGKQEAQVKNIGDTTGWDGFYKMCLNKTTVAWDIL